MTLFNMLRSSPILTGYAITRRSAGEVRKTEKKGREDATGHSESELGGGAG